MLAGAGCNTTVRILTTTPPFLDLYGIGVDNQTGLMLVLK